MTSYVQRHLGVDQAEADRLRADYWRRYGATLLGLVRHHGIDPHHFLRETHDFDPTALLRAERGLARTLGRLPGRKVLLSNAPGDYAGRVLRGLGLHRHFAVRYPVERMRVHGVYRPKPSVALMRAMRARERIDRGGAARAVLVDDSPRNLRAARAAGFATVLLASRRPQERFRRLAGAHYLGARLGSLAQLPALAGRIRR